MSSEAEKASGYADKIAAQQKVVDELDKEFEKKPSDELRATILKRADVLRHMKNLVKDSPKERARAVADKARKNVQGKFIASKAF